MSIDIAVPIRRRPLHNELADRLRHMIVEGELARGAVQVGSVAIPFGPISVGSSAEWAFEAQRLEELRTGKSSRAAVQIGYDKAFSAILDGNATTLISALILAQYGTGPIKGFAVTLTLGLVTSMFSAIMVTRLMVAWWLRRRRPQTLAI